MLLENSFQILLYSIKKSLEIVRNTIREFIPSSG